MQDEEDRPDGGAARLRLAARWRRFDRMVQELKARHADTPTEQLQATIDEACAAMRQEMEREGGG